MEDIAKVSNQVATVSKGANTLQRPKTLPLVETAHAITLLK